MRLLSALMAGGTALAVFLFLREVLPGAPWAWTVGGLAVGAAAAVRLRLLGRAARRAARARRRAGAARHRARAAPRARRPQRRRARGSRRRSALLSKLAFVGLVPGVVLAVALGLAAGDRAPARTDGCGAPRWRSASRPRPSRLRARQRARLGPRRCSAPLATADHPAKGARGVAAGEPARAAVYIWQLYLPRLPFMEDQFAASPIRDVWVNGFIGALRLARHARGATACTAPAASSCSASWCWPRSAVVRAARRGAFAGRVGGAARLRGAGRSACSC